MKFKLLVVISGFCAAVLILLWQVFSGSVSAWRLGTTALMAVGLAVRYVWVIFLLKWPLGVTRITLLLLVWCAVPWVAWVVRDGRSWLFALAALCGLGAITEFYNWATRQWETGSPDLTQILRQDHVAGGITAAAAAVLLVAWALVWPGSGTAWVMVLVLGDWARLIGMIFRHRRVLHGA